MKGSAKLVVAIVAAALVAAILLIYMQKETLPTGDTHMATVTFGSTTIRAEVVDTQEARELGLSGRDSLPEASGMLFVFDEPGSQGIWMKDMRFPIDIVWIEQDGTVITIAHDVSPSTYPEAFYPERPTALYVLELPAGYAAAHGLAEGDRIVVK